MKLQYTANALRRLRNIVDQRGNKVGTQIADRAEELEGHPELGPEEQNLVHHGKGHRSLLVGTLYKIVYLIVFPVILITDIFDVRQDPDKMKP